MKKYSKDQLQQALMDFNDFIKMTKSKGTPIRLFIVRDLIKQALKKINEKLPNIRIDPNKMGHIEKGAKLW